MQLPKIILSHETFNSIGSWAITPILASSTEYIDNIVSSSNGLNAAQKSNSPRENVTSDATSTSSSNPSQTKWLILCEDQSIVDLKALINNLKNEDYTKVSIIPNTHTSVRYWLEHLLSFGFEIKTQIDPNS